MTTDIEIAIIDSQLAALANLQASKTPHEKKYWNGAMDALKNLRQNLLPIIYQQLPQHSKSESMTTFEIAQNSLLDEYEAEKLLAICNLLGIDVCEFLPDLNTGVPVVAIIHDMVVQSLTPPTTPATPPSPTPPGAPAEAAP